MNAVVGGLLAVVCIVCLSAVTRLGRRLDTDALAQLGRAELVARLPDTRAALEDHLEREAPHVVRASLDGLLELMPRVGQMASAELTQHLAQINADFEERVVQLMAESIQGTHQRLAGAWPELSGAQRLERLVGEVAADFNATFAEAVEALYPEYELEMTRLRSRLVMLRDADAEMLSERDRLQREIIETMLRLILREGGATPG
jgi:hypothetical protein